MEELAHWTNQDVTDTINTVYWIWICDTASWPVLTWEHQSYRAKQFWNVSNFKSHMWFHIVGWVTGSWGPPSHATCVGTHRWPIHFSPKHKSFYGNWSFKNKSDENRKQIYAFSLLARENENQNIYQHFLHFWKHISKFLVNCLIVNFLQQIYFHWAKIIKDSRWSWQSRDPSRFSMNRSFENGLPHKTTVHGRVSTVWRYMQRVLSLFHDTCIQPAVAECSRDSLFELLPLLNGGLMNCCSSSSLSSLPLVLSSVGAHAQIGWVLLSTPSRPPQTVQQEMTLKMQSHIQGEPRKLAPGKV